ncbi:DUF5753 domain-containing protein [Streptomyces sp. NBC_01142]|uniref:DUF5753 domain-containing protein n=1 Tax=Streptomyces sp. NBC_01142 TaxID=2975865 RepID=UPI002259135F|nr:DUF5753 domain-containing protein [Streptomyces sp. NBC_01142]MCX4818773.1 DUF5753 domain-containing protein [Streptomyces sp. NBC_01142]
MTEQQLKQTPSAWRHCGHQVQMWRQEAGGTCLALGEAAGYAEGTVRAMEVGRRRPTLRLLTVADDLYGARGKLKALESFLVPDPFPARTVEFMDREANAIAVQWYEPLLIPGLLQTESYARALLNAHYPPLDEETVERRVAARVERGLILSRRPTAYFGFIIEEMALRRPVGGPGVMKAQSKRLLEAGKLRNVDIQVVPTSRGAHPGNNGPMVLLESPDHEHHVYEEGQSVSHLTADLETVSKLTQRLGMIRTEALSPSESAEFITMEADAW